MKKQKIWYERPYSIDNGALVLINPINPRKDLVAAIDLMRFEYKEGGEKVSICPVDFNNVFLIGEDSGYLYSTNPNISNEMAQDMFSKKKNPCNMRTINAIALKEAEENLVDKILKESVLKEDAYDDFLNFSRFGKKPKRTRQAHDQDALGVLQKAQPGDILQVGKYTLIMITPARQNMRSQPYTFTCIEYKNLDAALINPSKAIATMKVNTATDVTVKGKIKPAQLKVLLRGDAEVQQKKIEKEQTNHEQKSWDETIRDWVVTMKDGNKAKAGDEVVVSFSNGTFKMVIKSVGGGQKNAGISIIRPGQPMSAKARTVDAARILKKA